MGTWVRRSIPGLSGIGFPSSGSHEKQQTEWLQMLFAFSQIWELVKFIISWLMCAEKAPSTLRCS